MALAGTTVWEVQTGGSDTNGGGFVSDSGGTDWSTAAAAKETETDGACADHATFVFTSASALFSTNDAVGNIISITDTGDGTHAVIGRYEIKSVTNETTVVLDRDPTNGTDDVGINFNYGGALATPGGLGAVFQTAVHSVAGMIAYIRSGDYNNSQTAVNISGGPLDLDASEMDGKSFLLKGYDAAQTRGSYVGTRPVIKANGNTPANSNLLELKGTAAGHAHVVAFVTLDGGSGAMVGVAGNGTYSIGYMCRVIDCHGTAAFYQANQYKCYSFSCVRGAYAAVAFWSVAESNTTGFANTPCKNCIAANSTGIGFSGSGVEDCWGCVSYNSGSDGFKSGSTTQLVDCVSFSDGGYAFNLNTGSVLINCADDGAASGRTNATLAFDHGDITLTSVASGGDIPFTTTDSVDPDDDDYTLNATANATLLKEAGIGVYGQTDTPDVNAISAVRGAGGGGGIVGMAMLAGRQK